MWLLLGCLVTLTIKVTNTRASHSYQGNVQKLAYLIFQDPSFLIPWGQDIFRKNFIFMDSICKFIFRVFHII